MLHSSYYIMLYFKLVFIRGKLGYFYTRRHTAKQILKNFYKICEKRINLKNVGYYIKHNPFTEAYD